MSRRTRNNCFGNSITTPCGTFETASPRIAQQAQQYLEENVKVWMKPNYEQTPPTYLKVSANRRDSPMINDSFNTSTKMARYTTNLLDDQLTIDNTNSSANPDNSPSSNFQDALGGGGGISTHPRETSVGFDIASNVSKAQSCSLPHSLSYCGFSQSSFLQGTSYSSPCWRVMEHAQPSAAASFFARATQQLNLTTKKRRRCYNGHQFETTMFHTDFAKIIGSSPPPAPPLLLRATSRRDGISLGKVKVMLRVSPGPLSAESSGLSSFLFLDVKQKQVSLYDPTTCGTTSPVDRRVGVAAPKMFAFDAVFPQDTPQAEIISTALADVIQSVVNGMDGCLFVYGNPKLGKTYTMIGESSSIEELGATPCAIAWLFKLISEQREKTGARFSVRASAVGVTGRNETIKDLLSVFAIGTEVAGSSPGLLLQDDPIYGTYLSNQSEIRAPTAEKAAFLLDAALAARSKLEMEEENRNSHFLFTLHVYQYRFEKGNRSGVAGGRSRLNLIDLGSCEKVVKPRDGAAGHNLSLSALGNVIIALLNGQKHVPYKDSKLTQLLREALGRLTSRAAMIAHVSSAPEHYSETLATIQLATRIHRLRRKKFKFPGANSSENSSDDRKVCRPFLKIHAISEDNDKCGSSDPDNTSSSEQSCDTVIFVGEQGVSVSSCHVKRNVSLSPRTTKKSIQNHNSQSAIGIQESVNSAKCQYSFNSKNAKSAFASVTNTSSRNAVRNYSAGEKNANVRVSDRTIINTVEPNVFSVKTKIQHHQTEKRLNERLQVANSSSTSDHTIALPEQGGLPYQSTDPQASKKYPFKHKPQYIKQNEGKLSTLSNHNNGAKTHSTRESRVQSDELWIDGPRFCKSKFENLSLKSLQKEQWVDGPGFEFHGHMDEHKKQFISKWVEEHSQHVQQNIKDLKEEVWIDLPPLKIMFHIQRLCNRWKEAL
ncbi:kinesin-like protein KIF26B [Tachypleus tridentatus]|uniref:kinesin-like protein KIF26B n=1 Tax=Tachypleus tridentatus TaxID=6853 RepID=UPI003FD3C75D